MTDLCRNLKIKGRNCVRFIRKLAQSYEKKKGFTQFRDSLAEDNLKLDRCQLEKDNTYFLLFTKKKKKPNKQQKCEQGIRNSASSN